MVNKMTNKICLKYRIRYQQLNIQVPIQ